MNKPLRVGIIGTGIGLRQVAPGFVRAGAEVTAVSGSSIERAREHVGDLDVPLITDDYRKVCESDDVDLICVTTPNEFHIEHMTAALRTNKHVYLEKPVGDDVAQTRSIANEKGKTDRLVVVGHQLRFNPYFHKMREVIQAGTIGRVYHVTMSQCYSYWSDPDIPWIWSFDVEKGGGRRLALGVHLVDLARYLLNEEAAAIASSMDPVHCTRLSEGEPRETFASDFFSATLSFPHTTVDMSTTASAKTGESFDVVVRGELGDITFDLTNKLQFHDGESSQPLVDQTSEEKYKSVGGVSIFWDSFTYYAQEIVDAIATGQHTIPLASTVEDAIKNMEVLDAALRSSQNGTRELLAPWLANRYS